MKRIWYWLRKKRRFKEKMDLQVIINVIKNILVYMMESLLMSGIQMKSVNSLKLQMIFEKVQGRCCNGKNI